MTILPYFVLSAMRKALFPAKNEAAIAGETFKPFDLTHLQYLPRDNDGPPWKEARQVRVPIPNRPAVRRPVVPFIYPNI